MYAMCLSSGQGVDRDPEEAARLLKGLADEDHSYAQFQYALRLLSGECVEQDTEQVVDYLKKAVDQRHREAQFRYALCLLSGEGVRPDTRQAVEYLKKAADKGHREAHYRVGLRLLSRADRNTQREAVAYLKKAADQGHQQAQRRHILLSLPWRRCRQGCCASGRAFEHKIKDTLIPLDLALRRMVGSGGAVFEEPVSCRFGSFRHSRRDLPSVHLPTEKSQLRDLKTLRSEAPPCHGNILSVDGWRSRITESYVDTRFFPCLQRSQMAIPDTLSCRSIL